MTGEELLKTCKAHFPDSGYWHIDYYDGKPEAARAKIGSKWDILLQLYPDYAIVKFGWGEVIVKARGLTPDQALSSLKAQIREHVEELSQLIGDESCNTD
jgi:hypothetical protein